MALPVAAEADDPVADPGDRLRPGASQVLMTHCTELPTAIARTGSDWTQLGRRSPLRLRGVDGQPANADFLPHFAIIVRET